MQNIPDKTSISMFDKG